MPLRLAPRPVCVRVCILLLLAGTACKPKIERFAAAPRRVCAGQATSLSWQVSGRAVLSAHPDVPGTGILPAAGSKDFTPVSTGAVDTTSFELRAVRGTDTVSARQDVVVVGTGVERPLVIATAPAAGDSLVAIDTLRPAVWDSTVRIDLVESQSDRPVRVAHGGHTVLLAPGDTSSTVFRGSRISGSWALRAAVQPNERLGDATHAPPDRLRLLVRLTCAHDSVIGAPPR